ncbi:MAG: hypothetical protein IPM57_09645 [Oligoflexia bacterium]|nr:hypothetical protein [Oligoflexia bacterium]
MRNLGFIKIVLIVYALFLAAYTLPRSLSPTVFCTRALECASLRRLPAAPFEANFNMQKNAICGDLAKLSNRMDFCQYRSEIFITDPWGYRNTLDVFNQKNDILIYGDSFTFGEGVSQEQIPAEQLSKALNAHVYNGAGKLELEYLAWLLKNLTTTPKALLFFHLERHHRSPEEIKDFNKTLDNSFFSKLKILFDYYKNFNPLEIISSRFEKSFVTKNIFPNRFESNVKIEKLINNAEIIYPPSQIEKYNHPSFNQITSDTQYFTELKKLLAKKQITLHVVLVPEKYTVYANLNKNQSTTNSEPYLNQLSNELSKNKVHSINLLPQFQVVAEKLLKNNKYIYWLDDTHWNPEGIKLAAEIIKDNLADF